MPEQIVTTTTMPTPAPDWYTRLPGWVQVVMQLGAVGVMMLVFTLDSREKSAQLRAAVDDARSQAREDRAMFREETKAQRATLERAVDAMQAAVARLDANHQRLKRDVDVLKSDGPSGFVAPMPREKEK